MGCESSQLVKQNYDLKISIVDSAFMKTENEDVRKQMQSTNICYDLFVSIDCFFQEFSNRYYNKIVIRHDNYNKLAEKLTQMKLSPNVYVILDGNKMEQSLPFNVKLIQNYYQLLKHLSEKRSPQLPQNSSIKLRQKKSFHVKILCNPGSRSSEETILEASLKKNNIQYEFFHSFQVLQHSLQESEPEFIISNYVYHRQVIELVQSSKTRVICYCQFDNQQSYDPNLYAVSNNYLQIVNDIKSELSIINKTYIKCTKAYLYTIDFPEHNEARSIIQQFDIEIRPFSNLQKMIKQTTYFFCVTVLAIESEVKKLTKYFEKNFYLFRVKIISIPANCQPSIKSLSKTIRSIKKGYRAQKTITHSIDIIDKHYDNIKFEQIKKQLEQNDISCFGYQNLSNYIKNKKFISPFIICNFEQRTLLVKYLKQLQSKAKIIIFCNKNKINQEIQENKAFSFVSSHFGKIIKFIKKTPVFVPIISKQSDQQLNRKIQSVKNKNKRISALKWCGIQNINQGQESATNEQNFQFLNISESTNVGSIKDVQKSVSSLFKVDSNIIQSMDSFKSDFITSLRQLVKNYKISYPANHLEDLLAKIKKFSMNQLQTRIKQFFQAQNELGLQINKSLVKTDSLEHKQVINMRQFLLLAFLNYFSGFSIPNIGRKKLKHWVSNPLIQKCQIGSYLFCKNFLIFYEQNPTVMQDPLSKYKIQLEFDYNTLVESDIYLNSFITSKDKFIFCPYSQFKVESIYDCGAYKTITLKYMKNIDFIKYFFSENVYGHFKNMSGFVNEILINPRSIQVIDSENRQRVLNNISRCRAIDLFQTGKVDQAIQIHQKLIKQAQEQQNLDSCLVNQLNYQLGSFYLKGNDTNQAAIKLKQLVDSDPGQYIQEQCQKMIEQVTYRNENQQNGENKISQEAMKAFIWLNNKEASDQEDSKSNHSQNANQINQQNDANFTNSDFKCLEIDELEPVEQNKNLGKQNYVN